MSHIISNCNAVEKECINKCKFMFHFVEFSLIKILQRGMIFSGENSRFLWDPLKCVYRKWDNLLVRAG